MMPCGRPSLDWPERWPLAGHRVGELRKAWKGFLPAFAGFRPPVLHQSQLVFMSSIWFNSLGNLVDGIRRNGKSDTKGVWHGVSKRVEDSRRWATYTIPVRAFKGWPTHRV
jgi:hypothetical protein